MQLTQNILRNKNLERITVHFEFVKMVFNPNSSHQYEPDLILIMVWELKSKMNTDIILNGTPSASNIVMFSPIININTIL